MTAPAEPMPTLTGPPAQCGLAPMDHHEKTRYRTAAYHAKRIYPGPVGECVAREILDFEDFGMRLANGGRIVELVDEIMKTPLP